MMKSRFVIPAWLGVLLLLLAPGGAAGQTLLTETTWGGVGAEFIGDVATAADGSAYAVGTTDSFAVDEFGRRARAFSSSSSRRTGRSSGRESGTAPRAMASPPLPSTRRTRCS